MQDPDSPRSGRPPIRRRIVAAVTVVVVLAAPALAWNQLGSGSQREREIAKALQGAVADCGETDRIGDISKDADGARLAVTCGPPEQTGQFVGVSEFDTPAQAEASFRRQAADPQRALCRTSTEVFLLGLFWADGMDPDADERERAAERKFCAAVGAGTPRHAAAD